MNVTEWITGKYDEKTAEELMRGLGLPSLPAKLLAVRGIKTPDEAQKFLSKSVSALHDPFLMRDMDKAAKRIKQAIEKNEKIAVYGDYDADGVTATYTLLHYLNSCGADCIYHIPDRFEDGYGVSADTVRSLAEKGVKLIVTVDTGITAVEETEYAKSIGIDMVITDHHKCGEKLPPAYAVVNPNREDCGYPFSGLAGVGVAFKLVCALCGNDENIIKRYLPYACIGTVADVMPIIDENRAIVAGGLERISAREDAGISALLTEAGAKDGELTSGAIGFMIGPRINAAGRMGSADLALKLLFAEGERAADLARELGEMNRKRQACEGDMMDQALALLSEKPEYGMMSAVVLSGKGWHHGVLGIVASRLCAKLQKPVILISEEDGNCRGSGRSVDGVSLHKALGRCSDLLVKYGGHDLAAGIVIEREKIDEFRKRLSKELDEAMQKYRPTLGIDFKVDSGELTLSQLRALKGIEPYGKMNEAPVLRLDKCKVSKITPIGGGRHLKMTVEHAGTFGCVYFGKGAQNLPFSEGDYIDIAFTPEINNFRGENVQLHIKDARPCEEDMKKIRIAVMNIENLRNGNTEYAESVEYNELGKIWRTVTRSEFPRRIPLISAGRRVYSADRGITLTKLLTAFEIFSEVGLMSYECDGLNLDIIIAEHNNKVDLNDSNIYTVLKNCGRE